MASSSIRQPDDVLVWPDYGHLNVIHSIEPLRITTEEERRSAIREAGYNLFGLHRFKVYGQEPIAAGEHQIRMEFGYDGGGLAKGGSVVLYVDGAKAGEGRVDATQPMIFSADETTDVGTDGGTPVSDDYDPKDSRFTGRIRWVQLDIDEAAEDLDHLITPEERLRIAMARQ